ncbi:hypothetical protein SAMN05518672_101884 [Chitinophaga sp. CF118]|nr:hypothetical protein SAMN05518672_101884 [Chitinophaga sp. CF118]
MIIRTATKEVKLVATQFRNLSARPERKIKIVPNIGDQGIKGSSRIVPGRPSFVWIPFVVLCLESLT